MHGGSWVGFRRDLHSRIEPRALVWPDGPTCVDERQRAASTPKDGNRCQLHTTLCNAEIDFRLPPYRPLRKVLLSNPPLRFSREPNILTAADARTWPLAKSSRRASTDDHAEPPATRRPRAPGRPSQARSARPPNQPRPRTTPNPTTRSQPHEGRGRDQADVEAAAAADRGQLHEGFPEARRGARPGTSFCGMSRNSPTGSGSRQFCSSTVPSRTRSGRS